MNILSEREEAVVLRLQEGIGMTCVAALLDISIKTASTYGKRAAKKLGYKSSKEMLSGTPIIEHLDEGVRRYNGNGFFVCYPMKPVKFTVVRRNFVTLKELTGHSEIRLLPVLPAGKKKGLT